MGTTTGGIVYPSSTDDPDVPADMQALAESIETGNAWLTSGFTAATGWSVSTFRLKRNGSLCYVRLNLSRTGTAITVAAGAGDISDTKLGDMPAGYWPASGGGSQALGPGTAGRLAVGYIQTDGQTFLSAVAGDGTNIATSDTISLSGVVFLG